MNLSKGKVKVSLIGYGYVGKTFHAPLIQSVPGLELTVVSSRHSGLVRADWPEVEVVSDPQDAATFADAELVVIASPNETHFPLAEAALLAGKHVVVDKPFTIDLSEARSLQETARRQDRILSVFHNRRWDGDFLAAQDLIANGKLGEVLHFESHIDRFRPEVRQRWREQAVPGGGVWYDLGPHLIDQALVLFGLPEKISANLAKQRAGAQADDWAHVLLDYGRLKVVLHASMMVAESGPRFSIHGTGGTWIKTGMDAQESQLVKGMVPGAEGWGADPKPGLLFDGVDPAPKKLDVPPGDYRQFYSRMRAAIREGQPNPVPSSQAIAVMAVIETALASARSGQVLEVILTDEERVDYSESRASQSGS